MKCLHLARNPNQPSAAINGDNYCVGCLLTYTRAAYLAGIDVHAIAESIEYDECGHNGTGHCIACRQSVISALSLTLTHKLESNGGDFKISQSQPAL
jgi:AhpD family alkylhydroperoxidase